MAEVRTLAEGVLWWVRASGSGATWATASAPDSGLFGYVRKMDYTSGATVNAINERGVPTHFKQVSVDPIKVTVNVAWTGAHISAASGSGASVPMIHLEHKSVAPENANSGVYHQFHGIPLDNLQWTEGDENTMQFTFQALAMNGPTASGYLS